MQALLIVTCSLDGHGVVMQRMPVSRVAQTGCTFCAHTSGRGLLQAIDAVAVVVAVVSIAGGGPGSAVIRVCAQATGKSAIRISARLEKRRPEDVMAGSVAENVSPV